MRFRVPDNMKFRSINDNDHEFLVDLHNDPLVLRNLTHPEPITMGEHKAWWQNVDRDTRQVRSIFTIDEQRVGLGKIYNIDKTNRNCVLGADIHKDFRGKGYAKYLWSLLISGCFSPFPDYDLFRVSLTTAEFNVVGQHIYRQLGFREEGRLIKSLYRDGKYYDQILMYLLKDDWEKSETENVLHVR